VVEMIMDLGAHLAEEYLECFDAILVDAPCSAESRFILEEPKTFGYWKPTKIKETAYVQRKLLYAAWQSLRPGGVLVYSTCTFAPEENEGQISKFLSVHDDVEVLPIELPGVTPMPCVMQWKTRTYDERVKHCLRMMPTKDTEGFFVAKLRKMS
jgi:16S rRNA (cytosine1407-C5)-methyltransferase